MRVAASLLCVAAVAANEQPGFADWMKQHSKSYATTEEYDHRHGIWQANRDLINNHNAEAAKGMHTYRMGLNHFGDMTNAEYRSTLLGFKSKHNGTSAIDMRKPLSRDTPVSVDWRTAGIVPDVKNQANCGSCWAFSAVSAMEAAFNQQAKGTVPSACTTKCGPNATPCCSFSEQELVDCTLDGKDTCDAGGDMPDGVDEIVKQMKGVMDTEAQYPYTSGTGVSSGVCKAKAGGVATGFTGFTRVVSGDEADLQVKAAQSVVAIAIDASQDSFQHYSDGVYSEPKCKTKADDLDHGVAIVGYGVMHVAPIPASCTAALEKDCGATKGAGASVCRGCCMASAGDLAAAGCTEDAEDAWCTEAAGVATPSDDVPYWLVRNSWGASWGMDGYILMSRNKNNQCGVATEAIIVNSGASDELMV